MLTGLVGIILPNAEYSGRIGLKALILGQEDAEEEVTWCNAVVAWRWQYGGAVGRQPRRNSDELWAGMTEDATC